MILAAALICSGLKLAGIIGTSWATIWGWCLVGEGVCLGLLFALGGRR